MAIHKNGNLMENGMHDFLSGLVGGGPQHGLEPFLPPKFPFAVLGFRDSIRVGNENIIALKLESPGWEPGVWRDTYRDAHRFQVKELGSFIRCPQDDGRIMARVHVFQYSRRRFVFGVEK